MPATTPTFTPGPWEFRTYAGGCIVVSTHDAPGRSVRDHLKGVKVIVDTQIHDDQSNASDASADARLIVAAPVLYEALKYMNHMGGDERGGYCICPLRDGSAPDHKHASSCMAARQALAKVEGGQ